MLTSYQYLPEKTKENQEKNKYIFLLANITKTFKLKVK